MDEYLTSEEISRNLKIHVITVRRWIRSGQLPALYFGKEYRVKKTDFDKFLESRQVKK